jgi:hypothetical protein
MAAMFSASPIRLPLGTTTLSLFGIAEIAANGNDSMARGKYP